MLATARLLLLGAPLLGSLLAPGTARAGDPDALPPRVLGMGGALRAAATGDAGPLLNPSGISLLRSYALEASYEHVAPSAGHVGHVSVVDSTSAFNVGGALYYTYATAAPEAAPAPSRHEGGLSLSLPLGERIMLGGTAKYVRARRDGSGLTPALPDEHTSGITFDAGLTVRPVPSVSLGVVGYSLRDMKLPEAPLSLGWGIGFTPIPELLVAFDGVVDFTTYDDQRGNALSLMGGGEYAFANRLAVRAGGGYDGLRKNGYGSLGFSFLSELGAIDLAARRDVSGEVKATFVGIAGRLFVPSP
jgi:hypothetical protein